MNKKIISLAVLSAMLCSTAVGCGQSETTDTTSDTTVKNEKTSGEVQEIAIWTDETTRKDVEEPLIENFNETTGKEKGVKAVLTYYGADYQQMLAVAIAANKGPEIMKLQSDRFSMIEAGQVMAFEDIPGGQDIIDMYADYLVNGENIINGKTYTLPMSVTTMRLIYNKDLFKECGIVDDNGEPTPPKTYDEMVKYAKIITENGNGQKFGFVTAGASAITPKWEIMTGASRTVKDISCGWDYKEGKYNFSAYLPAINAILQMRKDGSIFPGYEQFTDAARAQFAEGNVGMLFQASWAPSDYSSAFPAKCDWGVADLPVLKEGDNNPGFTQATLLYSAGSSASKKLDATAEVLKFYYSDDFSRKCYEAGKYIPIRPEAVSGATAPDIKGYKEYANTENTYVFRPIPDNYLKLEGDDMSPVIRNIINGSVDAEEALKDLDARYNAALKKAIEEGLDMSLYTSK